MSYEREKQILLDSAGTLVQGLLTQGAFIAGGAVTSVFSRSKINDFDVFCETDEALQNALARASAVAAESGKEVVDTQAALSFYNEGHRIQIVKAVVGGVEEIISKFDFTICRGAYTNARGFVFGADFLVHLAQRRLVYNIDSGYPVCSLYRTRKFIERGFQFSGIDAIKLGLRIQALQIDDYMELKRQLMGIDTLFLKDLTDSLVGQGEKKYDFNDFMATLEPWLDRLNVATGMEE